MLDEAPAKLNLCLYVGEGREDGLHEICSIFQPVDLVDRIEVSEADVDEVKVSGIEGPELGAAALRALRDRGWSRSPVRIEIEKRIPVAAGLGGGSADAAAVLRLAGEDVDGIAEVAATIGSDVPSQLDPRTALVRGAGELVEPLPEPAEFGVVLVTQRTGLSAAEVYAEADRLGGLRPPGELEGIAGRLREAAAGGESPLNYAELLVNDLEPAVLSLAGVVEGALVALRDAGASVALVSGSGPTAFGLFTDMSSAMRAAGELAPSHEALAVAPRTGIP